ncbi:hypothetical protein NLB96_00675 [Candidatus Aminicenantes bacterium AC-335-K20]|jgi:hypothetical protein|nr:hypothetical protein [SCandidatus Aminicenantes bacterium Aminicenantia_JdfR_composite]MCP2596736.1 hypothetical protein [Candidatus Aminicenantes bacterium AC-335-G13]MCP2618526.1 hypothetical protein [Candidatus Aminicenantes bacterium AC-335-A11]MCP2619270.1 hypothetical protein [Candidatus Aminicenantes bacterium AC-335-K20]MCP2620428.1 hypothetical protein [Candidatus Aminicenantes bacterium AC-334-E05]
MNFKIDFFAVKRHVFSFLIATFIVCFVLYWMFYFLGTPFTSKEKEFLKRVELEREAIKKIDISVKDAGYLKKKIGYETFYIPALVLNISNLSENEFENLRIIAEFSINEKRVCRSTLIVKTLKSWENKRLFLKCIDFLGFGTVIQGMNLSHTMKEVHYELTLRTETAISITPLTGILRFRILSTQSLFGF